MTFLCGLYTSLEQVFGKWLMVEVHNDIIQCIIQRSHNIIFIQIFDW